MKLENKVSEILDEKHRYITQLMISRFDGEKKNLYTLVPRSLFGSPIPFVVGEKYNIINSGLGKINLYKVVFKEIVTESERLEYLFEIENSNAFDNIRSELRYSVDKEAVYSDFVNTSVVRILDISYSGARIETSEKILSDYIELFFDENNVPKRALGKVLWSQFNKKSSKYMYGLRLDYRE